MIVLEPYNPDWPSQFAAARAELLTACGNLLIEVHHVGSTAIPGLAAKPVIDMLPVLRRYEDGTLCVPLLQSLGYTYRGDYGIIRRHYFVRGTPRSHQAHMFAAENPEVERHLLFRDYLRAHAGERDAYAALKGMLAEKFGADRKAYSEAKTPFCERIDRLARTANARAR